MAVKGDKVIVVKSWRDLRAGSICTVQQKWDWSCGRCEGDTVLLAEATRFSLPKRPASSSVCRATSGP